VLDEESSSIRMRAAPAPSFEHTSRFTSRSAGLFHIADGKIRFQPVAGTRARWLSTKEDYDKQREREPLRIAGICGSIREGSYTGLALALALRGAGEAGARFKAHTYDVRRSQKNSLDERLDKGVSTVLSQLSMTRECSGSLRAFDGASTL
jgi:hypothetical protein